MILDTIPILGTEGTFTFTSLNSLAALAACESTAIDVGGFFDVLVWLSIPLAAGTPADEKVIRVFAYGSVDGVNFGDNATGTDAALTLRSPSNLIPLGLINTPDAGGLTYKSQPFSLRQSFGVLPAKAGIVIQNKTNLAFGTGCTAKYRTVIVRSTQTDA